MQSLAPCAGRNRAVIASVTSTQNKQVVEYGHNVLKLRGLQINSYCSSYTFTVLNCLLSIFRAFDLSTFLFFYLLFPYALHVS